MSSSSEHTAPSAPTPPAPPARPAVSSVLRESFISYFQRDGQEVALRLLDELAHQFTCEERGDYLMGEADDAITRAEVLGAVGDLRQAANALAEASRGLAEAVLEDREERRIALAIADTSAAVAPLADALDAALMRYLGREVAK